MAVRQVVLRKLPCQYLFRLYQVVKLDSRPLHRPDPFIQPYFAISFRFLTWIEASSSAVFLFGGSVELPFDSVLRGGGGLSSLPERDGGTWGECAGLEDPLLLEATERLALVLGGRLENAFRPLEVTVSRSRRRTSS